MLPTALRVTGRLFTVDSVGPFRDACYSASQRYSTRCFSVKKKTLSASDC